MRWFCSIGARCSTAQRGANPLPNPLACLGPALDVLTDSCSILPAIGGAVEDLLHPDQDERDDVFINKGADEVTAFLEDPEPSLGDLYKPTPALPRSEEHLYRFFVDGSLRTYHLGTAVEGRRSFPVLLAQIGAAVVGRRDDGTVRARDVAHRLLLLVPHGGRGISDTAWGRLSGLSTPDGFFEVIDTTETDVISGDDKAPNLADKAGGKARHRMHKLEIDRIATTDDHRSEGAWLVLDGAVKLDEFINAPNIIGVAKSFRKDPQFSLGRKRAEHRDVTAILASLPCEHRTAVFASHGEKVGFWYVRLREQKDLDYPLMGVVKVELPTPDRRPVPRDLADHLSRALVAERNVTPHGLDRRWHCHLYPIYLAEQAIKSGFFSQEVLMGAVRWQAPAQP